MTEIFLTDELTDQDKLEDLDSIRQKLISHGAEINPIESSKNLAESFMSVMSAGGVIWAASISDNDVFNILKKASVFVGMIMDFQSASEIEDCNKVTSQFCSLMEEGEKAGRGKVVTRILYDMFLMVFPPKSKAKYFIYCSWLNCVSKKNSTYLLDLEKRKVERFIEKCEKDWEISAGEVRNLRRSYQLALQRLERFEEAASAMEQLLGLYEEAEQTCADAVQDGHSCILQSITTENQFGFDHLRAIDVIRALDGQPVYRLLEIFIGGDLDDFENFLVQEDAAKIGINDENLVILREKMRLLTLVELTVNDPDVSYKMIEDKLELDEEGVEDLVVRAFQLKLLRGRLDQGNERISTTYAITRDFGPDQWLNLKEKLELWQTNLESVRVSIDEVNSLDLTRA